MTAAATAAVAVSPGLIARLRAELRPQFAAPVITVDPSDPVMGGPSCKVPVCERVAVLTGMCSAHHQRWVEAGRPDAAAWAAAAPALRRWLAEPPNCSVASCRRARCEFRLCHSHVARWEQAGRPDRAGWIADGGGGPPLPRTVTCRFHDCGLDSEGAAGLCQVHRARWARNGRPPVEAWLADCAMFGRDRFDLRALPVPMRLEIAYAIQRRVDARRTKTRPDQVRALLRKLAASGASSLLDRSADDWNARLGFSSRHGDSERRFLLDAVGYLRDLAEGAGWDTEYPRDVWLLRRLGYPGRDAVLRFDRIEAAWLRELAKRWARWRLSTGTALATVLADVRAITRFARSFPSLQRGPEALTRELIEVHLAHLVTSFPNPKSRTGQIGSLASLLRAARQHDWEPRLPRQAALYREDYPRLMAGAPRALPETVMTQLERDENLARFADPAGRLLAQILMSTGLRVGDGCKLALDCIVRDGQDAPYLRYVNHKMRRDAFVPIDTVLAEAIEAQQQAVTARYPQASCLLPRATRNLDGKLPFSPATFRGQLIEWLHASDIRDELGRPVHVTPHQWRHTFVICTAAAGRGTVKSGVGSAVPHKYPTLRESRMAEPGPGSFLFAAIFSLTCLTSLTFRNRRLPGTLRNPVQITFGTRLINSQVPQETVRRLLDHSSHQMTAHYARLSDQTIREQWERARKVGISGEELPAETGPLAEAAWMKNNLARAKMALPNGYCALPLQQRCEYANACLTCPVFVTTAEFLPQHRRQLAQTRVLIDQAEQRGQQRLAEMNRTVEKNLTAIIGGLTAPGRCGGACPGSCACTPGSPAAPEADDGR